MKRFLLSIFAIVSFAVNAQDMIKATGFNEDFTAVGPTTDGTLSIYWWGKEAVGQHADCDAMSGNEKTLCEGFGCTRTRTGDGDLKLSVTQAEDGWSPIGFSIDGGSGVDITGGSTASKVEVSLKNEGTSDIEVYFTFMSKGVDANDKSRIATGNTDATKFGGVVAAGATYTASYNLADGKKVAWVGSAGAGACTSGGGTMVGDNCVTDKSFSATALTGVEFSINGSGASTGTPPAWHQAAITAHPVTVYYIRGGATGVGVSEVSSSKFNIFPSPASDIININFTAKENVTVSLSDITGRVVLSQNVNAGTQNLGFNVADLSKGMYFVTVSGVSGQHTEKVLVK